MKCWNCKKKDIPRATRVPVLVISASKELFRNFCDTCYQEVKELRESGQYPPFKGETRC